MPRVFTYANHSAGRFDELVNNDFAHVDVMGWGTPWKGYQDKTNGIIEYANSRHPEEIIIYLDGFDSRIVK